MVGSSLSLDSVLAQALPINKTIIKPNIILFFIFPPLIDFRHPYSLSPTGGVNS